MLLQGFLQTSQNNAIAYQKWEGNGPGVLFLGGFRADMEGTKAQHLLQWAQQHNRSCVLFDYTGHGKSSGLFETATLSQWLEDTSRIFEQLTQGPQIVIGSSMGGWLMLLLAKKAPQRLQGLIGIGCAPDFTYELIEKKLTPQEQLMLEKEGSVQLASRPYPISKGLLEDGHKHLILNQALSVPCPVHLMHGLEDESVPFSYSQRLMEKLEAPFVNLHLIKQGDHRLQEAPHLNLLTHLVSSFS